MARDGCCFVGPDNGIFTAIINKETLIYQIEKRGLMASHVSRTFHGRDIFAPVAARLSAGLAPSEVGRPLTDPILLSGLLPEIRDGVLLGRVVRFDRFGNAITNIRQDALSGFTRGGT